MQLRGRNPLVLVPVANPDRAAGLVAVAGALAPPEAGRVLLLTVVVASRNWQPSSEPRPLERAQAVLREAMAASIESGVIPEALSTVAAQPWREIMRVAKEHRCESLMLGLTDLSEESVESPLDELMSRVDCDIAVLRSPKGWQLSQVSRILVPMAGRGGHERLLARLLASLVRTKPREVTFLKIVGAAMRDDELRSATRQLTVLAYDLCPAAYDVKVVRSQNAIDTLSEYSAQSDLVILGVRRFGRRAKLFGDLTLQLARRTPTPLILICRRG
jgi:nucleotide-binding universal stress UspA family protein